MKTHIDEVIAHLLFNNVEPRTLASFIDLSFFDIAEKEFMAYLLYVELLYKKLDLNQFNFEPSPTWFQDKTDNVNLKKLYELYLWERIVLKSKDLQESSEAILDNICLDRHKVLLNKRGITDREIEKYHISSACTVPMSIRDYLNIRVNIFTRELAKFDHIYMDDSVIIPCVKNGIVFNVIIRNLDEETIPYIKYSNCCPEAVFFGLDNLRTEKELYLCEGAFDAIAIESQEGKKALAFSSGVPYLEQLTILYILGKRYNVKFKLMFDNDAVGEKIAYIIQSIYKNCEKVEYDKQYKDPSEYIKEKGALYAR